MENIEVNDKNEKAILKKLSVVGIGGNIALTAFKFFAGVVGRSGAMISDAVHSLSDVLATLIALIGVKMSRKKADEDHPYGHERLESVATLLLGIVLALAGFMIGKNGVVAIVEHQFGNESAPGLVAVIAAIVSIVVKEIMFWYTRHYAKIMNSSAFMADAWHHRSDAMSSVGSLIGVVGARLGFAVMDPLASVIICIFILKVSFNMLKEALSQLVDKACSKEYDEKLRTFIATENGVIRVDKMSTRKFGNRVYVDLEIAVDGDVKLRDAHQVAQNVHNAVENNFPDIKHIMIHVNPA